ncbi:hypothetical protein JOQ06_000967 [Pogonophryne albipinna]|uniref:Uncharacterized protein n=1 Tax=Pogonophryne albipinna TaxID=1090488 RepID=A0AAD6B449_9TELE|nr:hypothetical protein JOQ06_000967 [Pogonophryne albipinna]
MEKKVTLMPLISADKVQVKACTLQSAKSKVGAFGEKVDSFELEYFLPPRSPAAPQKTPAVARKRTPAAAAAPTKITKAAPKVSPVMTPLDPTPPTVPRTKRRVSRLVMLLQPAKAIAGEKAARDCSLQTTNDKQVEQVELQPFTNPMESL